MSGVLRLTFLFDLRCKIAERKSDEHTMYSLSARLKRSLFSFHPSLVVAEERETEYEMSNFFW